LLAEAFWMMEGYFTRTLGMHRVYNSAFMNMLKEEKNSLYRLTIKNTQEFDKEILKRFVNFMSNPDEETAVAQFGVGDKYFGVCTLMVTMPGLPMFGHGQIEGFTEKYGMEYRRSYRDEKPDLALIERHEKEIFPLLRRRRLFAGVEQFFLFDFIKDEGYIDENVFAYSNGLDKDTSLVFYNNCWQRSSGTIVSSCAYTEKDHSGEPHLRGSPLSRLSAWIPAPAITWQPKSSARPLVSVPMFRSRQFRSARRIAGLSIPGLRRFHANPRPGRSLREALDQPHGSGRPRPGRGRGGGFPPNSTGAGQLRASLRRCGEALLNPDSRQDSQAFSSLVERTASTPNISFPLALAITEDGGNEPSLEAPPDVASWKRLRFLAAVLNLVIPKIRFFRRSPSVLPRKGCPELPRRPSSCLDFIFIEGLSQVNQGANKTENCAISWKSSHQEKAPYPGFPGPGRRQTRRLKSSVPSSGAPPGGGCLGRLDMPALQAIVFAFATSRGIRASAPARKREEAPRQLKSARQGRRNLPLGGQRP
jgi:hypothetical protein